MRPNAKWVKARLALAGLVALAGLTPAAQAEPIAVKTLFRKPEFADLRLAPNGRTLAALATVDERLNLHLVDLATMAPKRLTAFPRDIHGYAWKDDNSLAFYLDDDGDESFALFAIGRDGQNLRAMARTGRASSPACGCVVERQTIFLDLLPENPAEILVITNERREEFFDVYRWDFRSGRKRRVELNPGRVTQWVTDHAGNVRAGVESLPDGSTGVIYRVDTKATWQTLARFALGAERWTPVAFAPDDRTLYVLSNVGRETLALQTFDPEARQLGPLIFGDDAYDVDEPLFDGSRTKLLGVAYVADRPRIHWLDDDMRQLAARVDAALPETFNSIIRARDNPDVALVFARSDREPGAYYLYDIPHGKMRFLLRTNPWIHPEEMAAMQPVTYPTRDGATIHGYLTLPPGAAARALPLVIYPHGGPATRDTWGFDPTLQFLASRGFAVLQMNYRGSTGYGRKFQNAGWGAWGETMRNDVSDGAQWAIAQGLADSKRVGILGRSAGGYLALASATFTPEQYEFAVSVAGSVDLIQAQGALPRSWELIRPQIEATIGIGRDTEELRRQSPLYSVDNIRIPLFLAHGKRDPRVPIDQTTTLVRELKRLHKDYRLLVFPDEGHVFIRQENLYTFYNALDEFLARFR
jgi:dipeptidyl aminopeptidase/acylaminoacyl peptidase